MKIPSTRRALSRESSVVTTLGRVLRKRLAPPLVEEIVDEFLDSEETTAVGEVPAHILKIACTLAGKWRD